MIIAIDGPSGAGKSSVAKDVAKRLNFSYLDTGAMYRAIAYSAVNNNVDLNDEAALIDICNNSAIEFKKVPDDKDSLQIFIDGENVTSKIRTSAIDKAVTPVCKFEGVRSALVKQQREIAKRGNYILDGRDIASIVFPNADLKIFLTASLETRAKRRYDQNIAEVSCSATLDETLIDMKRRDFEDTHRDHSPLVKVKGAVVVDSTNMTQSQVVDKICDMVLNEN